MQNINILMISSTSQIGGGPRLMFKLGKNLSNNFNVFYALPLSNNFINFLNSKNYISISERKLLIQDFFRLIVFIKKNDISIIHAHGKGAGLIARILKFLIKKPIIYTLHGIHIKCHTKLYRKLYLFYEKIFSKFDDLRIFVSKSESEFAKSLGLYKDNKFSIINNGIENYHSIDKNMSENDQIIFKKIDIISICRFVEQKNIVEIIKIAKFMKDLRFLIIGDGPLFSEILHLKKLYRLDNVILPGSKDEIFNYLSDSKIFLSTSIYEGLPISILEAMSVGLPIVASKVEGNIDTIIHGKNGYLYNLGNVSSASKFIRKLTDHPNKRKKFGVESKKRQRKFFSLNDMVLKHEKIYSKVI